MELVRAPLSVTRFAHTCRSGFSSFCYSHPLLTELRHSDSSLSLETASGLSFFVCAKASAPPQAGGWPNLPQPGWVGTAGVMSLCLPRKGGTKDGVPKDVQPHPQLGYWVDFFPLPASEVFVVHQVIHCKRTDQAGRALSPAEPVSCPSCVTRVLVLVQSPDGIFHAFSSVIV